MRLRDRDGGRRVGVRYFVSCGKWWLWRGKRSDGNERGYCVVLGHRLGSTGSVSTGSRVRPNIGILATSEWFSGGLI